jgi:hypothetical protein
MKSVEKQSIKIIEDDGLSYLIHDCDVLFSKYIRLKYSDKAGMAECFTCGNKKGWQEQQCAHYVKRGNLFLRWDERNARVCCQVCNEYKHGNYLVYTRNLELQHPGITEILMEESRIVYKPTRDELKSIIADMTEKLSKLKIKL